MSRLWTAVLLALAACSSPPGTTMPEPVPVDAAVASDVEFPRLATYFIETHIDEAQQGVMAKTDLVVVDAEAGALDRAPLDAIRERRPDALVLAYLTSEEIGRAETKEQPLATARYPRIAPEAWLVEPGSTLTQPITATTTRIRVANPGAFTVTRPPSDFYDEDEPTYLLVGDEHMRLVAIIGNELRVERGYRSIAKAHAAGTRVASHVVFFAGTWMLNLTAPAWREQLADEAASLVADGPWNGVFLDVCFSDVSWLNGGLLDLDRNGVADDKRAVSATWSAGMGELVDTLRGRLGPNVPIISNPGAQDCPHERLDGILMEGWPIGMPPAYLAFSTGEERYQRWSARGRKLTIANAFSPKIGFGTIAEGQDEVARTDYQAMRFGLANALMADGFYTFDNGVFGHYVTWWYDEYDGAGRGLRWLGGALGPARVDGALRWREFEGGLAVVNTGTTPATFDAPAGFTKLAGTQDWAHNDGAPVISPLTIASQDAYVLARH